MTAPAAPLEDFVSDAEIARRWGVGEDAARIAIRKLERDPRFPKKDPLFSHKRYWPAVRAFMAARAGISLHTPLAPDGEENFNAAPGHNRRSRHRLETAR